MELTKEGYNNRLRGRIFGVLCEFEKGGDWKKFLDSIIIELMGYKDEEKTINYYILFYKLSSLQYLKYEFFRTTIFDCMALVGE